ncbi:hypothetical protein H5399_05180 [Tessaracoccus sp. MC1627]|uniref:hypothetical protein n=1 Tax=Tessaracoccus sp. MC1627 TaxID=2760312 RepID=UPI001601FEEE|nr:hypothetical protein [Tessaracoccus sp. MC1627]MBB1511997.1 hypothetical protein [Tessaracoccus sp. MC1627]
MSTMLPTLPGLVEGIVAQDLLGWAVQCRGCGHIGRGRWVLLAVLDGGLRFHEWPDGTNPRLCRDCRLARGCTCYYCAEERRHTR